MRHSLPSPATVHIWYLTLDQPSPVIAQIESFLAPDEWARAARFRSGADARRFIVRRGGLRRLLAAYLHCRPADISFVYGPQGKPALTPALHPADVQFNLSDTGEMAVYAVGVGSPLGVDIEARRYISDAGKLAAGHFSPPEMDWMQRQPADDESDAFLRCWTCKEAVVKALGDGLTRPLPEFTAAHWQRPPRLHWGRAPDPKWTLRLLSPPAGYVAALASPASVAAVQERRLLLEA